MLEKMQRYVVITEKNMAEQKEKCRELSDEVEACRVLIESLEVTARDAHLQVQRQLEHKGVVSQFRLKHLHSGGQIVQLTTHQAEIGCNVFLEHTNGVHSMYRVYLPTTDPCPSPSNGETVAVLPEFKVDAGLTMCDVWEGFYNKEKGKNQVERRKFMRRRTGVKKSVCKAFGCCDVPEESTLFRAVCGFVEGSQEQCHQCDDEEDGSVATRCSEKDRKKMLTQMINTCTMEMLRKNWNKWSCVRNGLAQ